MENQAADLCFGASMPVPNFRFEPVTYLQTASPGSKLLERVSLLVYKDGKSHYTHTRTLAQMKLRWWVQSSTRQEPTGLILSRCVLLGAWSVSAHVCVRICARQFACSKLRHPPTLLFDGAVVWWDVCVLVWICVCVCLSPGLVDSHRWDQAVLVINVLGALGKESGAQTLSCCVGDSELHMYI